MVSWQTMFLFDQSNNPNFFYEVASCSESDSWLTAVEEILKPMQDTDVSDIVDLSENLKPTGYKWVY